MGTRGFAGLVVNGELKIGYKHSDSYPSGLGEDVLKWAKEATTPERIAATREAAAAVVLVEEEAEPTAEQIERLKRWSNLNVGNQSLDDWYALLRETQGDLGATLEAGFMVDASAFPGDSLFAEWGYIVDLDAEMFEVYRGFQQGSVTGRFAGMEPRDTGYAPVTLMASWPFSSLPDDLDEDALSGQGD